MVGVAVNCTSVPWQMLFTYGATEMLTGSAAFPTIKMELETAGLPLTHDKLDISWQVTTSPFVGG